MSGYYVGQNVRAKVSINAADVSAGITFDGTPGTADVFKVTGSGFTWEPRNVKTIVEEIDVDPNDVVIGGLYYTITIESVLSYSYRENLFRLIACGAISTTGTYDHAFAVEDFVLFGEAAVEYTDEAAQANEIIEEAFANFAVTAFSISESPEGYATLSVSGIATGLSRTKTQASLSTVQDTEVVSWSHFCPTLNGTATYRVADIGFDWAAALTEGEFDHACTTPATLSFVGRSGMRDLGWNFGLRMDTSAYDLIADTTALWTSANSFVWNNGLSSTDEREISLIFGDAYIDSTSAPTGAWGRQTREVSMKSLDGTTPIINIDIKNARTTIPA